MEERKLKEKEFANERYSGHFEHEQNRNYYSIARKTFAFVDEWIQTNCPGKKVLDYCCGLGETSFKVLKNDAEVVGIDLSDKAIAHCQSEAKKHGLENKCSFYVMDAENTEFKDNSFDLAFCMGVLHHLNLQNAYQELSRLVKPEGKIFCLEALGHNPLIQLYRRLTPQMRTEWETEHILTVEKIKQAEIYFEKVDIHFFNFSTLFAVPFRNTRLFNPFLSFFEKIDNTIFNFPIFQKNAWMAIFILQNPKRN